MEHNRDKVTPSSGMSLEPLFNGQSLESNATLEGITAKDSSFLICTVHRVVANMNHQHPRLFPYKAYHIKYQMPYWRVCTKVKKMKFNLLELIEEKCHNQRPFTKLELINHFYSLISALEYLHQRQLSHQNIKPENILFDFDYVIYLSDCAEACHDENNGQNSQIDKPENTFDTRSFVEKCEKNRLYAEDLVALGFIFLMMGEARGYFQHTSQEEFNKTQESLQLRLSYIHHTYGEEIADLISQMISITSAEATTIEDIRRNLEAKCIGSIAPLTPNKEQQEQLNNDQTSIMLLKPTTEEHHVRGRTGSVQLSGKNYLFLPWKYSKSLRTISKYGVFERRSLGLLKRCFKIGSCQNLQKVGKKVGFNGLDLIQSDNGSRLPHSRRSRSSKVQQISTYLSNFENIKSFQVEFTCDNLTCKDLFVFGRNLLKLKYLKKLKVGFICGQILCDSGLELLGHAIKRLRELEDLHLYLNRWTKITDKGFNKFCQDLSNLSKLKRLVLEIEEFPQLGDSGMSRLGRHFAKFSQLIELDLTFFRCSSIAGTQLAAISEYLAQLKSLRKLVVNMKQSCGFMNQGITGLSNALTNMIELRELKLNFLSCDITEGGFTALADALEKLIHLNGLDLTFGNNDQVTNKAFEALSISLAKLVQLKSLKLVFFQCDKLTDSAIFGLKEALTKMKNLNELELNFRWCMQITDHGICKLGEAFLNLKFLNKLSLSFDGCRISDTGVSRLGQDLAKLEYLNGFKFEVRECKGIQGSGISQLGECLTKLVKLGQIQLNFCGCGGNYRQKFNEGILSLRKSISKLPRVNLNENTITPNC